MVRMAATDCALELPELSAAWVETLRRLISAAMRRRACATVLGFARMARLRLQPWPCWQRSTSNFCRDGTIMRILLLLEPYPIRDSTVEFVDLCLRFARSFASGAAAAAAMHHDLKIYAQRETIGYARKKLGSTSICFSGRRMLSRSGSRTGAGRGFRKVW